MQAADLVFTGTLRSYGAFSSAIYEVRDVVRGDLDPGDIIRLKGRGHLPFVDSSHPVASLGARVLVFGRSTDERTVVRTLGLPAGVVVDWWLYGPDTFGEPWIVEERTVEHLRRLEALPDGDPQAELAWALDVLDDPECSWAVAEDLVRNSAALPAVLRENPYGQALEPDASDLRELMGPDDMQRLVDKLDRPDQGEVLGYVAALLVDVPDPAIDAALERLVRHLVSLPRVHGSEPDPVFGNVDRAEWAGHHLGHVLRVLALRRDDPQLHAICDEYDALVEGIGWFKPAPVFARFLLQLERIGER